MNETIKCLLERRSCRSYTSKPVKREDLELIVKCGQFAATGNGMQAWHISVVTDRALLDKISQGNIKVVMAGDNEYLKKHVSRPGFDDFYHAPAAILVSGPNSKINTISDCANATENMILAAHSLGLGSCYIASYKECLLAPGYEDLRRALEIPDGYIPFFSLAVGYEDAPPSVRVPRKPDSVSWVE